MLINSLTLLAVTFVPFPTSVLADAFGTGIDIQTAIQLFGLTFILMAICYTSLARFVYNEKGTQYTKEELGYKKGIRVLYSMSIAQTVTTFFLAYLNITASIVLYIVLFSLYLFPIWYTDLVMKIQRWKIDRHKTIHSYKCQPLRHACSNGG